MLLDALVSGSFILIGSSACIYRLLSYSYAEFSKILPEFVSASVGFSILGVRSLVALAYKLFWRRHPVDPLLIEEELSIKRNNLLDWCTHTLSITSIVHSLFCHHNCRFIGYIVLTPLIILEIITYLNENSAEFSTLQRHISNFFTRLNAQGIMAYFRTPYVSIFLIVSTNILGFVMKNNYIGAANVPYGLTWIIYRPPGLCQDWSIRNSINDYMMLAYVILMTEALIN